MGIKGQNRHHTHYCSSMVFVELVELAASGWVCSSMSPWFTAFEVRLLN